MSEIHAVFRNRYSKDGKLKPNQTSTCSSNKLASYRQLLINDKEKAQELATLIKKEKCVINAYIEEPIFLKPCVIPNDSDYSNQWHLNSDIYPPSDIDAEEAWDINTGRNDVIIAVCDGGIDYNHPDLDPGDRSRIIAGYDSGDDDNDPLDDLPNATSASYAGHGTNIAGIIGAITNNQSQVSGIMWNCKIMPVKMVGSGNFSFPFGGTILDYSTTAFPSDVADAIDYAVNNGAHIINLSYGFKDLGFPLNDVILRVPLLHDAISNAYYNNVLVVAAMGNEYNDGNPTNYPAAFAHEVMAVGNTNQAMRRSSSSSTGPHINISAPGSSILTTDRNGGTGLHSGTSMSTPVVCGVAGLIISQGKDRSFNLTNDDVRHILEITADDIELYGIGFDEETGHGKVNAHKALELLKEPNVLYHGISHGGNTSITNLNKWELICHRWGLAAGMYYDVDRYEITKHISFDVPFCDIPQVWLRERESECMSFGNPNDGFPYAIISNVSPTGFDVRYAAYYVRTNSAGITVNKWVPAAPNYTKVAYTAVGEFNLSATAGPIIGPDPICTAGGTFTLQNRPHGTSVRWSKSSNLDYIVGQGTNYYTVKAQSSSAGGPGWVKATITKTNNPPPPIDRSSGCSFTIERTFWVGKPNMPTTHPSGYPTINLGLGAILNVDISNSPGASASTGNWCSNGSISPIGSTHGNNCTFEATQTGNGNFYVTTSNACGTSPAGGGGVDVTSGGGGVVLAVTPNPATTQIEVTITEGPPGNNPASNTHELTIYDFYGQPTYSQTMTQSSTQINTSGWNQGLYYATIIENGELISTAFLIE